MPDVRETILVETAQSGGLGFAQAVSRIKFALRWIVVATAGTPLRYVYLAIYRLHIWYALRILRRFPGTRAIYLSRSMAKGEITIGVSDIDMVIFGDWPEPERVELIVAARRLMALSPLYDSTLWQQVHTVTELRTLWESDYHFQSRFDQGRTQWKLAYGSDCVQSLPEIPRNRVAGAHYMDTRLWWMYFIASTFGKGPLSEDAIFRNSICYKAVTELLNIDAALQSGKVEYSRRQGLEFQISVSSGSSRDFLERMQRSARRRHLTFDGDIQEESLQFLLQVIERITSTVRLDSQAAVFRVDAVREEMLVSPSAEEHALVLVEHARRLWPGYRAAYLLPSLASFTMDDLLLLIEVDPTRIPCLAEIKELWRLHDRERRRLPQRVVLFLLLPEGAYQVEFENFIEVWRVLVSPAANPDIFTLLGRAEFLVHGEPRAMFRTPVWTDFANDLVNEELGVRRSAMANATPDAFPSSIEIVRNIYRHIQLEIIQRTAADGLPLIPLTPAAIERALLSFGLPEAPILNALRQAYESELNGDSVDVRAMIPEIMAFFSQLAGPGTESPMKL
jgi:hypothetical protein